MIRFRAFRTQFAVPLLTLLFPLLAEKLGLSGAFPAVPLALAMHELSHLAMARILGIEIREIQLTPFGGSAQISNPYRSPALNMAIVALAGPAANLLLALICASLAQWQLLGLDPARNIVQISLFIMGFNLLPALPLDGGRVLYCILQRFLPEKKALRICLLLGKLLSLLLCLLAILGLVHHRRLNLSFLLAAIFIWNAARDEHHAFSNARMERIVQAATDVAKPQRMQIYQVSADAAASDILPLLRPHECAWLLLMQNRLPYALMDARSLLLWLTQHNSLPDKLSELPCFLLSAQKTAGAG